MNTYLLLLKDMVRRLGWPLAVLIALILLVGLTEGLATALLFSLLIRLGISGGAESGTLTGGLEDVLSWLQPGAGPWFVLALISVASALQGALFIWQSWMMSDLARRYTADWQLDLFSSFIRSDWLFLTENRSGDLVNAVVTEPGRLAAAFFGLVQLVAAFAVTAIYLAISLFVSWQITLLLIGLGCLMLVSISGLYKVSLGVGQQTGPFNATLLTATSEPLQGAKIIKLSNGEDRALGRVASAVDDLRRASRVANFLPSLVRGIFESIGTIGLAALLVAGALTFQVQSANLLVVLALFVRLLPRLTSVQTQIHGLNTYAPAIIELQDVLMDAGARREREAGTPLVKQQSPTLRGRGLAISYSGRVVVKDLDIDLAVPGFHGIIGGSGAGKSSLMHALVGLVPTEAGSISLGDARLEDVALSDWRRAVALVPQETTLFNATVADNLRIAMPDATMDDVKAAAQAANAHEFIAKLSRGYDTMIGDQGVLLSGGQRQRLGIARALLMKPAVLLLDEPTSALDPESEREVIDTLNDLRKSVGIVVVAHRLATVRNADTIFLLENGAIAESGNWEKLIARRQRFFDLATAQHMVLADTGS